MTTARQEIAKFAKLNHFTAKPMCGGVIFHKAHTADWRNDFSKVFDSWAEAHAYLLASVNAVKDGNATTYPWEAAPK